MLKIPDQENLTGNLWVNWGTSVNVVEEYIQTRYIEFNKPLYWLEPALHINDDGRPGYLKNFAPLGEQLPEQLPPLEAAFLFGNYSNLPHGLHIVAAEQGCRWFEFSSQKRENAILYQINESKYSVLVRKDFDRFFGQTPDWYLTEKLKVTEFWQDTGLLAFWLQK